jgi:hypothetical protein
VIGILQSTGLVYLWDSRANKKLYTFHFSNNSNECNFDNFYFNPEEVKNSLQNLQLNALGSRIHRLGFGKWRVSVLGCEKTELTH